MPIKNFDVGNPDSIAAAELNRYLNQQQHVRKPSTESVTSSTTLQNDDALFLPVAANTSYWVQAFLIYDGPASNGMKWGFTAPTGSTMGWVVDSLSTGGGGGTADLVSRARLNISATPINASVGAGVSLAAVPKGMLQTGSNSGTLRIQWCQNASSATAVRMINSSVLMIRKLNA